MCALLVCLVLVMVTQAAENCIDICKLSLSRKVDGTRLSGCKCILKENPQSLTHFSEMYPKNSGIYYEPAEKYPRQHLSFGEHPFYIFNPTVKKILDNRISSLFGKMLKSKPAEPFERREYEHNENIYKKYKRNGNSFNSDKGESNPLYLDLDIKYSTDSRRMATKESIKAIDIMSIKQNLEECINLHVLINARKINEVNKLKGIEKFEKYVVLSDSDILSKIINDCRHSANIMQESLQEIKQALKKNYNMIALKTDDKNFTQSQIRTEVTTPKTFTFPQSTDPVASRHALGLGKTITNANLRPLEDDAENFSLRSDEKIIKSFPLKKTHNDDIADIQLVTDTLTTNILSIQDTKKSYLFTTDVETTTESIVYGDSVSPHFNTDPEQDKSTPETDFDGKEMSPLDSLISSTKAHFSGVTYARNDHNDFKKNKNELFTDVGKTITTNYERTETSNLNITSDDNILQHQYIPLKSNKDRNSLLESEIKIPKLVTREFPNNTVVSFLNGTEKTPNNDFGNTSAALPKIEFTNGKGSSFSEGANNITKVQYEKELINTNYSKSSDIHGSLYFLFGKDTIPARFTQTSDGTINIGIDGISLCDKINTLENASILLKVLCRCIQFENCEEIVNS